jgi:hypothetical protein
MDDAVLVTTVAARYVQAMGPAAIRYLCEMEEQAAFVRDAASVQAWRDIIEGVRAILLAPKSSP